MIVVSRPILTISEEQTQAKVNKIANFIVIKETKICHKKCLLSFLCGSNFYRGLDIPERYDDHCQYQQTQHHLCHSKIKPNW